jgi:type I restriction enzyme S subunit
MTQNMSGSAIRRLILNEIKTRRFPLPPLPEQRRIAAILDKANAIRRKREEGVKLTEELLRSTFLDMFGDPATNPKGLEVKPLSKVATVVMGSSPPSESYNHIGNGVPLVNGPVEFSEGMLGLSVMTKYTTQPTQMCQQGDLLLCVRGSTTGRTNIAGFDACIGRGVAAIRAFSCQNFVTYFITLRRQSLFDSGKGSIFQSITQEQLRSLSVLCPPPQAQEKFAELFCKQQELIKCRKSAANETESLFNSLVQRAFRGEL